MPAITALAPLQAQDAALPQLRAQLVGVALTTFADGRADALLARAASGLGYTLTFPATGQTLNIAQDVAGQFIAPGSESALLQFELVGEAANGALIARASVKAPATSTIAAARVAASGAAVDSKTPPAVVDLANISSTARQIDSLARLAPANSAAWISMRPQLAETAHLHTPQSAQTAVLQGFLSLLPAIGVGYERAMAKAVLAGADPSAESLARFPQARVIPAGESGMAPDRSGGAAAFDESGIAAWSAQQLSAHEQGSVHWRGNVWPGTAAQIEIGQWRRQQPGTEEVQREMRDVLPADLKPAAWLRIHITPPTLGPLDIYAVQVPGHGAWARIRSGNDAALQELKRLQASFADALQAAQVRVDLQRHADGAAPGGRDGD